MGRRPAEDGPGEQWVPPVTRPGIQASETDTPAGAQADAAHPDIAPAKDGTSICGHGDPRRTRRQAERVMDLPARWCKW